MSERCILFADVVGSTVLYEKLGDAEAKRAVERCLKRVQMAVQHMEGRLIKSAGDGVLADFSNAATAMAAACEMQQRVEDLPPVAGHKLAVRVGFHSGPVIEDGGDIFGDSVNLASRLASLARPGQIIFSATTLNELPELVRKSVRALPTMNVKGKSDPVDVCEVIWRDEGDLTLVTGHSDAESQARGGRLVLSYEQTLHEWDVNAGVLTIGREKSCTVVIGDPRASRQHALVERRGDKFVLIDQSTNGTWLARDGEAEVALRREEAPLLGRGRISFGHPATAGVACVTYISE